MNTKAKYTAGRELLYYEATGELMTVEEKEKVKDIMEDKKLYAISFVDDKGVRWFIGIDKNGYNIRTCPLTEICLEGICLYTSIAEAKVASVHKTKPTDYEFEIIEMEEIIKPVVVGYKIKE